MGQWVAQHEIRKRRDHSFIPMSHSWPATSCAVSACLYELDLVPVTAHSPCLLRCRVVAVRCYYLPMGCFTIPYCFPLTLPTPLKMIISLNPFQSPLLAFWTLTNIFIDIISGPGSRPWQQNFEIEILHIWRVTWIIFIWGKWRTINHPHYGMRWSAGEGQSDGRPSSWGN